MLLGFAAVAVALANGEYEVTEQQGRISVRAINAPVTDILQAIATESGIEVVVMDGVEGTTSIELQKVTPNAAIGAIAPRVVAITGEDGNVSKVYVLPEGEESTLPAAGTPSVSGGESKPFQFTFDPSQAPESSDSQ